MTDGSRGGMIGTQGFWLEDNTACEVVGVVDELAGLYEFRDLDDPDNDNWVGFIRDFAPEC